MRAAKTQPTPFSDRVQGGVLQQLRRGPLNPSVRRFAKRRVEFLDQPRLADAGLADDQNKLAFARPHALPAAYQEAQFLLAADKGRQSPRPRPPAAAARAHDAEELDRLGDALEFARALLLDDEEACDLSLDVHG